MSEESNVVELRPQPTKMEALAEKAAMTPKKLETIITQLEGMTKMTLECHEGVGRSVLYGALIPAVATARQLSISPAETMLMIADVWDAMIEHSEAQP